MPAVKKPASPSRGLKAYLDAGKKPSRMLGSIERHILTRPEDQSRRQDVIHPSEMIKPDWCIRAEYFKLVEAQSGIYPARTRHPLRMQAIFDTGHAAHAKWQGYIAEMGAMYGTWKCSECQYRTPEAMFRLDRCAFCGSESVVYDELALHNDELMIAGSTDGWVTGMGDDFVLEIKTIGTGTIRLGEPSLLSANDNNLEKAFESIRRPFRDHRMQGQMYLYLMHDMYDKGLLSRKPPEEVLFLYECKANQAYKEFVLPYRPEQLAEVLDLALVVADAVRDGVPPTCNHGGCKNCEGRDA